MNDRLIGFTVFWANVGASATGFALYADDPRPVGLGIAVFNAFVALAFLPRSGATR